jgi:Zn-dependent protease with chaperone function
MYALVARASLGLVAVTAVLSVLAYFFCPHLVIKQVSFALALLIGFATALRKNSIFLFLEGVKSNYKFVYDGSLQNRINHLISDLGVDIEVGYAQLDEINAFAAYDPIQQKGIIAFTPALVANATNDELLALAAHEVAHLKNKDSLNKYFIIAFQNLVTLYPQLAVRFFKSMANSKEGRGFIGIFALLILLQCLSGFTAVWELIVFFFTIFPPLQYLVVLVLLNSVLDVGLKYFHHSYSRNREYEADRVGAELTSIGDMVSALRLLNSFEEPRTVSVFDTHPPTDNRIARLTQVA